MTSAQRPAPTTPAIPVTQPTLPPLAEVEPYLREVWGSRILTNAGPLHNRLEEALRAHLGVDHLSLFNNGTVALMAAAKALGLRGGVVTTPFSFVATAHAIAWAGASPVFADIDPETFNLDPGAARRAAAVTPDATGLLPVHCYGTPCDVDGLARLAQERGLKVLYDAAHAFGVRRGGASLLRHGDMSVLSFHATKVFNTVEGGAVVCHDAATKRRVDELRNFGIVGEASAHNVGLNGKLSEVHAAVGLASLPHLDEVLLARAAVARRYRDRLGRVQGIHLPEPSAGATQNFSYFPVLVGPDFPVSRDALQERLKEKGILSRRYFHPLIPDMEAYQAGPRPDVPVARRVSSQVLCLPMYAHLTEEDQGRVVAAILEAAA